MQGAQVFSYIDKLLPVLEKELKTPIPKAEPNQERLMTMKRAAFQAAIALNGIPNSNNAKLQFIVGLKFDKLDPALKTAYEELLAANK